MSESPDSPTRLAEEMSKALEPTEEELAYKFSNDEMRFLCERLVLKVDMRAYNPLYKLYQHYEKHGRMANRSPNSKLKLLMKAHKKYQNDPRVVFTDDEKDQINRKCWEVRKSQNCRYLEYCNFKSKKSVNISIESSESDITVIENAEQSLHDVDKQPTYVEEFYNLLDQFGVRPAFSSESQSQSLNRNNDSTPMDDSIQLLVQECVDNIESDLPSINSNTENSMLNSAAQTESEKHGEISSQQSTESYQTFNKKIPLTSTQSQSQ